MAFQLAYSFIFRFWTLQPQTNYLENWKLKMFLITTQGMIFVFVCLFSARVKDYILWKLHTFYWEKVFSFKFAILFQHIAQPRLNRLEEGPFFEVFTTFLPGFSVKFVLPLDCYFAIAILIMHYCSCWLGSSVWFGKIHLGY